MNKRLRDLFIYGLISGEEKIDMLLKKNKK